ncbi:hypothetical protein STAFG_8968 [Streptomyces afghaniensis 772]|uniref:Uncharacterized protein n=1 Tax=Streptomyces afghaniensis 772 TaxID=1283301 RepID=S4MKI5_9ACTN|nr:hypothetical protein STAFG_8968 [Streptomyces afghaniensis 772]
MGTLKALGAPLAPVADAVTARIARLACPGGGYTYREPEDAADALSTAAAVALVRPRGPHPTGCAGLRAANCPTRAA